MVISVNKLNIHSKMPFLLLALWVVIASSCSTFTTVRVGIRLLFTKFDGDALIRDEHNVRAILETILLTPENYTVTGYTRKAFSPEVERTASFYHSFYTITGIDKSYFTLSFNGTRKKIKSEGVWAINKEADKNSYISFKFGDNEWDVQEIRTNNGINIKTTLKNIILKIDNNTNYYVNDHKKSKVGRENCITALQNTMVEND
jgi:hypothetical protein